MRKLACEQGRGSESLGRERERAKTGSGVLPVLKNLPEIRQHFPKFVQRQISACSRGDRENYHSSRVGVQE
jgi:hypothetical protein